MTAPGTLSAAITDATASTFYVTSATGAVAGSTYAWVDQELVKIVGVSGTQITVMRGSIFDVAVDIRPDSATYGHWVGEVLTDESREMLWIPEGFAHGFSVLSEFADVVYKATSYYSPSHERCIRWNDPVLGIEWPLNEKPLVSRKDEEGKVFGKC